MKVILNILVIFQIALMYYSKSTNYMQSLDKKLSYLNKEFTKLKTNFLATQKSSDEISFIEKSSINTN